MRKFKHLIFLSILISINFHLNVHAIDSKATFEKTIFLTGAAGFVGSNFLKYMFDTYQNYKFLVLDALTYAGNLKNIPNYIKKSQRFEFYYGSITHAHLIETLIKQADYVVHFAAETHVTRSLMDNTSFIDTNVKGTQILIDALLKHKNIQRFIHISTSEVYGPAQDEHMSEEHQLCPTSPYAASKVAADRLVYAYCCSYNIPAVIVRPFNIFGPYQHIEKVIPRFITNLIKKQPLTLHGDGNATRDWLHVLDVCKALDIILHCNNFDAIKHQTINLGSGVPISVLEVAHMLLKYFNAPQSYLKFINERPGQVAKHIADNKKAQKLLNWHITKPIRDSLPAVIEWYKNNQDWWENMELIHLVPIKIKDILELY